MEGQWRLQIGVQLVHNFGSENPADPSRLVVGVAKLTARKSRREIDKCIGLASRKAGKKSDTRRRTIQEKIKAEAWHKRPKKPRRTHTGASKLA